MALFGSECPACSQTRDSSSNATAQLTSASISLLLQKVRVAKPNYNDMVLYDMVL